MNRLILSLALGVLTGWSRLAAQEDDLITKSQRFTQTSAAAPALESGSPFRFQFVGKNLSAFSDSATLQPPSGVNLPVAASGADRVFTDSATTASALNALYGSGTYTLTVVLGGFPFPTTVNLGADAYPVAPQLVNFTAAQSINATADFDVTLNGFTGGTVDDYVVYRIRDANQLLLVEDSTDGTDGHFTVSADTLAAGKSYTLELNFVKISGRSDVGALPLTSAFASTTTLAIKTAGSGGGPDTTPPTLLQSLPATGDTLVSALVGMTFLFSEKMDTTRNPVTWTATKQGAPATLTAAKFSYFWGPDGTSLTVLYDVPGSGWPAGLVVNWNLPGGSSGFRDVAGNPLVSASGSFLTPGGTVVDCNKVTPVDNADFGLLKLVNRLQTGTGAPGIDPTNLPMFEAFSRIASASGDAAVEFPADPAPKPHQLKFLSSLVPSFQLFTESMPTQAALDTAYPAGAYAFQLRDHAHPTTVLNSVVLTFIANGYPPAPHFGNYAGAQAIVPASDFNLTWDAFTGASAATDFISLEITDATGKLVFQLPDACKPLTLAVTATSAVLPKELFSAGKVYVATLSFFRLNDQDKAMPGTVSKGVAATAQVTRMQLKTIGGATVPVLRNLVVNAGGSLDLTVDATVGHTFTLEHTTTLGGPFTQQIITNPPSATFHLTVPIGGQDFFRGRSD